MQLYTLDSEFQRQTIIEKFDSVIWTDRYGDAGEFNLVVPANSETVAQLSEGTFIAEHDSKEVMIVETQSIEDGLLTVTGYSLVKFLNNRVIRTSPAHEIQEWNISGFSPGGTIGEIVNQMCIDGAYLDSDVTLIEGPKNKIPGLNLGDIDDSGDPINVLVPFDPVFDVVKQLANTYSLGFSMYLDYANDDGYSLLFTVYKGVDHTRDNDLVPLVQFSPNLDSLIGTKEVRSISGYKNVAYVFAAGNPDDLATTPGIAYADPTAEDAIGFDRRVIMVRTYDITSEMVAGNPVTLQAILDQKALDTLANNNYTRMLDGEIVPQNEFKYGRDYFLGDIVELQSLTGFWQKARVTEYIRSKDTRGEKAYPTVSVIG